MKRGIGMKRVLVAFVCLLLCAAFVVPAQSQAEEKPWADFSVAALSSYIWRGFQFSKDSIVVQPSMSVGYYGFYINFWSNIDTDPYWEQGTGGAKWNETDITVAYGNSVGPFNFEGGYLYYAYDSDAFGASGLEDTQEIYASIGLDVILQPTFTVYRDIAQAPAWYFLFGISHSLQLADWISIDGSVTASYLMSDNGTYPELDDNFNVTDEDYSNFHDGVVSLSVPMTFGYFSVTPTASYSFPLTDDAENLIKSSSFNGKDSDFFYGGLVLGIAF